MEDFAGEIVAASARLEGRLAPVVLEEIKKLPRVINSYYSNLTEGHSTAQLICKREMSIYLPKPANLSLFLLVKCVSAY